MENWKTIEGFNSYEVSDLGRVRSLPHLVRCSRGGTMRICKGRLLRLILDDKGYFRVGLSRENRVTQRLVHRLVADAFLPNPLGLPEVNHKGVKTDNRASKLEWKSTAGHGRDKAKREQQGTGVYFHKGSGKYMARYSPTPGIRQYIGYFKTKDAALEARRRAVRKLPDII